MMHTWCFADLILGLLLIGAVVFALQIFLFKNPVYSVFGFIILIGILMGILFLIGFEFFPLVSLIIYVGAIAVLFLFIVMLLSRAVTIYRNLTTQHLSFLNFFILFFLLGKVFQFLTYISLNFEYKLQFFHIPNNEVNGIINYFDIYYIASSLYTEHSSLFSIMVVILFIGLFAPSLITSRLLINNAAGPAWLMAISSVVTQHWVVMQTLLTIFCVINILGIFTYYFVVKDDVTNPPLAKTHGFLFLISQPAFFLTIVYTWVSGTIAISTQYGIARWFTLFVLLIISVFLTYIQFFVYLEKTIQRLEELVSVKNTWFINKFMNFPQFLHYIFSLHLFFFSYLVKQPQIVYIRKKISFLQKKTSLLDLIIIIHGTSNQISPHVFISSFFLLALSLEVFGVFCVIAVTTTIVACYYLDFSDQLAVRNLHIQIGIAVLMFFFLLGIVSGVLPLIPLTSLCPVPVGKLAYFYNFFVVGCFLIIPPMVFLTRRYKGSVVITIGLSILFMLTLTIVCMLLYMYFID